MHRKWSDDFKSSDHLTLKGTELWVLSFEFWVQETIQQFNVSTIDSVWKGNKSVWKGK